MHICSAKLQKAMRGSFSAKEPKRAKYLMKSDKIKIAVLVSGGGTNLQALIDSQKEKRLRS